MYPALLLLGWPEVRAEFESQFSYADQLFEEVFDSNAIHVRYPLLFLNQRAPGHGDLGRNSSRPGPANQRQLEDAGARRAHQRDRWLHRLRHDRFFSIEQNLARPEMMAVIGISRNSKITQRHGDTERIKRD